MRVVAFMLAFFLVVSVALSQDDETKKQMAVDRYEREIKRLEEEIDNLKTRVLETKKSLKVFSDMVLHGTLTGTKVVVQMKTPIEDIEIFSVALLLDGFEVKRIEDKNEILKMKNDFVEVYDEDEVIPGSHSIDIAIETSGKGAQFRKRARFIFIVRKGEATTVSIEASKSPVSKKIKSPDDIDVKFFSEQLKLLPKVD